MYVKFISHICFRLHPHHSKYTYALRVVVILGSSEDILYIVVVSHNYSSVYLIVNNIVAAEPGAVPNLYRRVFSTILPDAGTYYFLYL
jgi:hypothetical protein